MESGLCVYRVSLCPSDGVPFVTQLVTCEGGLFGDADPVGFTRFDQFDSYAFDGYRITNA